MADVLLLHHVLGRTSGMVALRDRLRAGGSSVHLPDLFEGRTFADRLEGRAYLASIGVDTVLERARSAAEGLPSALVYAGVSVGALAAYELARTRACALGALLISSAFDPDDFRTWPRAVPVQIHVMADDPLLDPGDVASMRAMADEDPRLSLFVYPGATHLFTDSSSADHDPAAARLLADRATAFLALSAGRTPPPSVRAR